VDLFQQLKASMEKVANPNAATKSQKPAAKKAPSKKTVKKESGRKRKSA
jgi:hypothetical protein